MLPAFATVDRKHVRTKGAVALLPVSPIRDLLWNALGEQLA